MDIQRLKALSGADNRQQKLQRLVAEREKVLRAYDQAISDVSAGKALNESLFSALGAVIGTIGKASSMAVKKVTDAVKEIYLEKKAQIELKQLYKAIRYAIIDFKSLENKIPTLLERDKDIAANFKEYRDAFDKTLELLNSRMAIKEHLDAEELDDEELFEGSAPIVFKGKKYPYSDATAEISAITPDCKSVEISSDNKFLDITVNKNNKEVLYRYPLVLVKGMLMADEAKMEEHQLTEAADKSYKVVKSKNGRQWDVVDFTGKIVEGGFFDKDAADSACEDWNTGKNG